MNVIWPKQTNPSSPCSPSRALKLCSFPFSFFFGIFSVFGTPNLAPSPGNRDCSHEARLHVNVSEQGQPAYIPGDSDLRRREFVFLFFSFLKVSKTNKFLFCFLRCWRWSFNVSTKTNRNFKSTENKNRNFNQSFCKVLTLIAFWSYLQIMCC